MTMAGSLIDKVFIGLDNAPAAFDIKGRILGPNGANLEYIRSETGVVAVLKGDKFEPLHLSLHHARSEAIAAAKSLALNLIETVKGELVQWSAAQAGGGPPPSLNVPPPTLATTTAAPPPVPPPASVAMSAPTTLASSASPTVMSPVVNVAPASTPLMTVRQPTLLQLLQPQQQYVLNQENGQLIPIVQHGMQMANQNFTSLPITQQLIQQSGFGGTQFVDLSSMQPVNVTQLRLSGVPSSMSMILPNGLSFPQTINTNDTTTVSSATPNPVVCAAPNINASQKILYSTDKGSDKEIKYVQGGETVQWTVPGSQTMLIPYQQLQDFTGGQGLANLQSQQFVSIAPAGGIAPASLPLTPGQFQQLQAGTIMQLNQKPITSSGSFINIISTGQASSPQNFSNIANPSKSMPQESRGQKRMADGTPNQLQLRPIAPAGSQSGPDKNSRDGRNWTTATARENTVVSMGMKVPGHGTIIHVSSGQQTNMSASGVTQDGTGMYIRHIDRNAIQLQSSVKDGQKQDITANKIQTSSQNVQMINLPSGMTVLQNPLSLGQVQNNSQVYMIPAPQPGLMQGAVMQPAPTSLHYNVPIMPMNLQHNTQFVPAGLNLNTQLPAQQLNIPIVQANPPAASQMNSTQVPVSQAQTIQQMVPQNTQFIPPTSQFTSIPPPQYVMQPSPATITGPNNQTVQYNMQPPNQQNTNTTTSNGATQNNQQEGDTSATNGAANQNNFMTPAQDNAYTINNQNIQNTSQQNFGNEANTAAAPPGYPTPPTPNPQSYQPPSNNGASQNYSQQAGPQPVAPPAPPTYGQFGGYGAGAGGPGAGGGYGYGVAPPYVPPRPWTRPPSHHVPPPHPQGGNNNYNYWQDT